MNLRSERAQGMVEFALLVPILLIVTLGVIDYSRFMYFQQGIATASRAGLDMAINHCPTPVSCGMTDAPVGDDVVLQAAYCAATPSVTLAPSASTCAACTTTSCATPCDSSCLARVCQADICISPSAQNRSSGQSVTVSVGYSFQPINPLTAVFFPRRSCWTGDPTSNAHTLCASYTATVS